MTAATNTTLGEIKLAGDLAGSNNANAPELTASGVTPGAYSFPSLTVDAKGRITAASSASSLDIASKIPNASTTQKGIVKIGSNISVVSTSSAGYQNIVFSSLSGGSNALIASGPNLTASVTTNTGSTVITVVNVAKTFTTLLTEINSQLSGIGCTASIQGNNIVLSSNTPGANSFVSVGNDNLFKYLQNYSNLGPVVYGAGESTISIPDASVSTKGVMKVGTGLTAVNGTVNVDVNALPKASESTLGVVKVGEGISVSNGTISLNVNDFDLPVATTTTEGIVKIGSGVNVAGDGTISVNVPNASGATAGLVKLGNNIVIDGTGAISIPTASPTTPGAVRVGTGLNVDGDGLLNLSTTALATSTTPGLVKIGTGLAVTNGVVSVDTTNLPAASKSSKGAVRIGNNIDVSNGVISAPIASNTVAGVVKLDTGKLFIGGDGRLNINSSLAFATPTQTGLVRIGNNISVDGSGYISVNLPDATTSTKGKVQIGYGLNVSNGVVSVQDASTTQKGIVQVGTGLSVSDGVISADIPTASIGTKGIVKIGTGLDVVNGVVSTALATTSSIGTVKPGAGLSVDVSGALSVNASTIPLASTNSAGAVRIGTGLNVDSSGLLSVTTATNSTPGIYTGYGPGLTVTNGVLSLTAANASTNTYGIVSIGTGLAVTNGVVSVSESSIPVATQSVAGIVKVGTGLTAVNGTISGDLSGVIQRSYVFSKSHMQTPAVSIANAATNTYTPNLLASNILKHLSQHSSNASTITIANPESMVTVIDGQTKIISGHWTLSIHYYGGSYGGNLKPALAFGNKYKFQNGTAPTISNTNGSSGTEYCLMLKFVVLDENTILVFNEGIYSY